MTGLIINLKITPPHRRKRGTPFLKKEGKFDFFKYFDLHNIKLVARTFLLLDKEEYTPNLRGGRWYSQNTSLFDDFL
jgi:hypothetical protein